MAVGNKSQGRLIQLTLLYQYGGAFARGNVAIYCIKLVERESLSWYNGHRDSQYSER
jgi:hypothetical protein